MTTSTANLDSISFPDLLQHAAWARRLAAQLVRDDDADDLVQDAWAAAGARPGGSGGRAPGAPRKWLAGVMRNLARFRARSAARRRLREEAAGAAVHGDAGLSRPDEIAERVETQRLLAGLVLELPAVYRDVVLLRFYDDLPPRAIATRLGIPAGTARSRLSVGLAQLRERLRSSTDWRRSLVALAAGGGGGGGNWLTSSWSAPARAAPPRPRRWRWPRWPSAAGPG